MIDRKVHLMPDVERIAWKMHGKKNEIYVAPDYDRGIVLVRCTDGIKISKEKALRFANMLVDAAEQLPD